MNKPVKLQNEYYDNSMLSVYKECPRKYFLRHVKNWVGEGVSTALKFGLAWHSAMNIIWQGYSKLGKIELVNLAMEAFNDTWVSEGMTSMDKWSLSDEEQCSPRTPGIAKEMLMHYVDAREHVLKECKLESCEQPFAVPVFPDEPNIWYIGRRDKDIVFSGDRILVEHKTTALYKKDGGFRTDWIEGWSPNSQCEGYLYQSQLSKKPARYVWIDGALVHKMVHDKFKFIPIAASGASLDAFLWEMRDWVMRIRSEIKRHVENTVDKQTHMTAFPKNTESCNGKYGLCSYISICRSVTRPDKMKESPPGFKIEKWEPFSILGMEKVGMKK